jgi:hypothetical protein
MRPKIFTAKSPQKPHGKPTNHSNAPPLTSYPSPSLTLTSRDGYVKQERGSKKRKRKEEEILLSIRKLADLPGGPNLEK